MRDAGRDNNETACWVALQLSWVEALSLAQIPCTFDDGNKLVLRMGVRKDAHGGGDLDPVDPCSALIRVAEQLRPLPSVLIVRWREPPHLFGGYTDDLLFALRSPGCQRHRPKNYPYGGSRKK